MYFIKNFTKQISEKLGSSPFRNKPYILIFVSFVVGILAFNNCSGGEPFGLSSSFVQTNMDSGNLIVINDGARFTNRADVTIGITSPLATSMYVTSDPNCQSGAEWESVKSNKVWKLSALNQESYVYVAFRMDGYSDVQSSCFPANIFHDTIAPVVTVPPRTNLYTNQRSEKVDFQVVEDGSKVKVTTCAKGTAAAAACQSGHSVAIEAEGSTSIWIVAEDRAGNMSAAAEWTVIADFTAPQTTLNLTPSIISNELKPEFVFSAVDSLSGIQSFECKLDTQAAFAPCTSPYRATVTEGTRKFQVRSVDRAGNISTAAEYSWTVDVTAPTVRLVNLMPANSNSTTATMAFEGLDMGAAIINFKCSLDGGAFAACVSPRTFSSLDEGNHSFAVIGIDIAGNQSTPVQFRWLTDLTAPVITLVPPPEEINVKTLSINFTILETGGGLEKTMCKLDSSPFVDCANGVTYSALAHGSHRFEMYSLDAAGNTTPLKTHTFSVFLPPENLRYVSNPVSYRVNQPVLPNDLLADGGPATRYEIEPALPEGLSFSTSTGMISGLPTNGNIRTPYTVTAFNRVGSASVVLSLEVYDPIPYILSRTGVGYHFCVIEKMTGNIRCFGHNDVGQFGNGVPTPTIVIIPSNQASSIRLPGGKPKKISIGTNHTCAIADGKVYCWGHNNNGQVGDGSVVDRHTPVHIPFGTGPATDLSLGGIWGRDSSPPTGYHDRGFSCAIENESAWCWGYNDQGQLGDGTRVTRAVPRKVVGLSGRARSLGTGYNHTCAATDIGVSCWGSNSSGQLGNGTTDFSDVPVRVIGINEPVLEVTAGAYHSCALLASGVVKCWGSNSSSQLGIPASFTQFEPDRRLTPIENPSLSHGPYTSISGTTYSGCAISASHMDCWGVGFGPTANFGIKGTIDSIGATGMASDDRHYYQRDAGLYQMKLGRVVGF